MAIKVIQGVMGLLVTLGWVAWLSVVLLMSPDAAGTRALFFASFFVASLVTFWMIHYWLSYRFFSFKRFQGGLRRTFVQGLPPSVILVIALWLQSIRAFSAVTGVILLTIVLVLEFVLFPKGSS